VANLFQKGREATEFGFQASGKADFKKVMAYVHGQQDLIRAHETPEFLDEEWGTKSIIGTATLTGKNEVTVNGKRLTAPKIILATGSIPRKLNVEGADQLKIYDNESLFWELDELPDHLLIVGGGPIGCEMAQAFRRLGSEVTMVNRGKALLAGDPPQMGQVLEMRLRKEGVNILHQTEVAKFTSATEAELKSANGQNNEAGNSNSLDFKVAESVKFSHVLSAIGRVVRTEGLGLENAGVEVEKGKIVTDEYFLTTNPNIYAVGDAYGQEQFSHGAEMHNVGLWNNILSPIKKKHSLEHFTWVTFTDPEVASFGWTEKDLKDRGIDFETKEISLKDDDRAVSADYRYGHLIMYLSKGGLFSGPKILGGCMIAPAAGEMIQELHLMNQLGLPLGKLTNKIYAYPVGSRINQKAARDKTQDSLLTERNKKLISWWYRLWN
jgi:pyruvate/2-oxoglutarate dehydrogenase complex dihydrolipoamide dehydrogenase (E3) component